MTKPSPTGHMLNVPPVAVPETHDGSMLIWGVTVGPLIRVPNRIRIVWGVVAALCAATLATAIYLKPSPNGHGTHEALGMPPCGFIIRSGLPCPTCGMTTSFTHFVRGQWIRAMIVQPAGFVFAALTALVLVAGAAVASTGRMLYVDWDRASVKVMLTIGLIILFGWGFKMAHGLSTGSLPLHGS